MVFINIDGKFNDNSYLVDAFLFKMRGNLAIYIIENNGMRIMIDTPSDFGVRTFIKKIKELNLYPIDKIILTHSHFDHIQGVEKLKRLIPDSKIDVLASEYAIPNLENPEIMNKNLGYNVKPIYDVIPLKEGDVVDINGIKLEILNFFGHTQDSIAILDKKNKNIFVGDAIMDKYDPWTPFPEFVPPDFSETEILKTFKKLRKLKNILNSISLAHFGVWNGDDFLKILEEMETIHTETKASIMQWYREDPSLKSITLKFHEKFTPNSKIHTKENIHGLELLIEWLVNGLKLTEDI